jgi:hypothetical protein
MSDLTDLDLALEALHETERRALARAVVGLRDVRAASGDHRIAAVFAALAVAAVSASDRERSTLAGLDFTPGVSDAWE